MQMTTRMALLRNLDDAGCDPLTRDMVMDRIDRNRIAEAKRMLASHKQKLLDDLHGKQTEIDCLDFLIFEIQNGTRYQGSKNENSCS